mgnify:CR=1 FL=1
MQTFKIPEFEEYTAGSVYCIGRNYAEHARELNNPVPDEPVVFLKPRSSLVFGNGKLELPMQSGDVHHEVEMVLLVGKQGKKVPASDAVQMIRAVAVGIDFTARDLQQKAKEKRHPWSVSKGFDTFAPVGKFIPFETIDNPADLYLELSINNNIRQQGNTKEMLFPVDKIIEHLTSVFTLYPGDLVFTGTPEGVGKVQKGDHIKAKLGNQLSTLEIDVS